MSAEDSRGGRTPEPHVVLQPATAELHLGTLTATVTIDAKATLQPPSAPTSFTLTACKDAPAIRIARPPARRLVSVLRHVLTRSAFESMIAPYIAQEQHEYYEALSHKDVGQARWIVVRMYLLVTYNIIWAVVGSVVRLIRRAS